MKFMEKEKLHCWRPSTQSAAISTMRRRSDAGIGGIRHCAAGARRERQLLRSIQGLNKATVVARASKGRHIGASRKILAPSVKTTPEVPATAATPLALTTNTQIAATVARKSDPP
jgi:hypothetical protein